MSVQKGKYQGTKKQEQPPEVDRWSLLGGEGEGGRRRWMDEEEEGEAGGGDGSGGEGRGVRGGRSWGMV